MNYARPELMFVPYKRDRQKKKEKIENFSLDVGHLKIALK
jgi:hypothetical protein